jgi:predicted nucleotidyltransferase component of viral defense system
MKDTVFFKQAELLLRILPLIYKEEVFALKGGTAINFFVRDLPRLSVDIDLTYLPVNDRDVNRHLNLTHHRRPKMTHLKLFFLVKQLHLVPLASCFSFSSFHFRFL